MNASVTMRLLGLSSERDLRSENLLVHEVGDETLMTRISEGDRDALAVLFRRYARLVRGIALRILRDKSEADDLLQDLFLFIHRRAGQFDGSKCSARSWIVQMTYHRAIDRRRYLQSRHFYTRLHLDQAKELVDPLVECREERNAVCRLAGKTTSEGLLDTLTEQQRNTLSLHFYDGYTFAEIAVKLNQSLGNVRNHYYRGLEKLRRQMFPGGNGYGRK